MSDNCSVTILYWNSISFSGLDNHNDLLRLPNLQKKLMRVIWVKTNMAVCSENSRIFLENSCEMLDKNCFKILLHFYLIRTLFLE